MSNFFKRLCCCASEASSPIAVRSSAPVARNPNPNRNSVNRHSQQMPNVINSHERRRHNPPKPPKKLLKLKSAYSVDTVRVADARSEDIKDIKFNCPICFRFFDRILISNCCQNYMCHYCANDVNDKVKKDDKTPVARCPFCNSEDFELADVDPTERPKKYTDSFYSTFKSNGKGQQGNIFTNTLGARNRDQLYQTNNSPDIEQNLAFELHDKRAASDGIIYMQREMQKERLSNTLGGRSAAGEDQINQNREFMGVVPGDRIEGDILKRSMINTEERKSVSSDSLNERDNNIDIIKEDEFESSVMPELERRRPEQD